MFNLNSQNKIYFYGVGAIIVGYLFDITLLLHFFGYSKFYGDIDYGSKVSIYCIIFGLLPIYFFRVWRKNKDRKLAFLCLASLPLLIPSVLLLIIIIMIAWVAFQI